MKTSISVTILTIAFLSAGAFAQQSLPTAHANVTVVYKNQAWPVQGQIAIDTCSFNTCTDI